MTNDSSPTTSLAIPMDPAAVFDAISNSRRRRTILSLSRTIGEHTVGDLSVEIAAIENEIDPSEVRCNDRTSVYISLIQRHLEKLDECGAIEYDERSKTVAPTGATEALAEYIRRLQTACYKPDPEGDS